MNSWMNEFIVFFLGMLWFGFDVLNLYIVPAKIPLVTFRKDSRDFHPSRFPFVSFPFPYKCHQMWPVVRFTAQKEHSGLGFLSITAEWVALVYPVRKRLITRQPTRVWSSFWCLWFALFHGCGRVFPFFLLFLFVFLLYPFYQVLWGICSGVVNFLVQCFFCCVVGCFVSW
jgi:hypothetical protein